MLRVGLFPNKTYTIGILNIPNDYFWDFLRGHLDGDGSITTYSDRWNTFKSPKYVYTRLWLRFISASREHVDWLQSRIFALSGTKGHRAQAKISRPYQRVGLSILKFGKKDSLKLLKLMYYRPEVPCLLRKKKIADQFMLPETSPSNMISL